MFCPKSLHVDFLSAATAIPVTTTATTISGSETTGASVSSFIAAQSGAFTDAATWIGGQIPSGVCSITIPAGITITFTGELINIEIQTLTIAGTFLVVSSGDITFQYPINIIVQAFGTLTDQTSGHKWYFLGGSLCTFYSSASFVGVGTIFWTYTTLPASGSQGVSYTVGSTLQGPFTFGVLFDGTIQTFAKVTFIVGITGDFSASGTWLGGVIPTGSFCNEVGGCKLYISSGCTLSTASLNGQCDINFIDITVATGATFELGSAGFVWWFSISIFIHFQYLWYTKLFTNRWW